MEIGQVCKQNLILPKRGVRDGISFGVMEGVEFAELPLNRDPSATGLSPGIIYISRIPQKMTPSLLRALLEPYGQIGHIFLAPKSIHAFIVYDFSYLFFML
jgi:RNA recognition motif. (a.k.a. RRM, RBD, or RNP domain)